MERQWDRGSANQAEVIQVWAEDQSGEEQGNTQSWKRTQVTQVSKKSRVTPRHKRT